MRLCFLTIVTGEGCTGRPRELVNIKAQLEDWRTMIRHLQQRKSIDARERIVLWGTSLSGGYVLSLAAQELNNIKAIMVQVPFA